MCPFVWSCTHRIAWVAAAARVPTARTEGGLVDGRTGVEAPARSRAGSIRRSISVDTMTAAHDPLAPPSVDRFGTPGSPTATRAMLLGSGELGKEVTIALQRLGVEVIAVDRYAGAPAHQVAHRSHTIDMTDPDEVRRVVELERPQVILPEIEAIATSALAQIEQDGLARVAPNASAVQLTMDSEGVRRLAADELGLPTGR